MNHWLNHKIFKIIADIASAENIKAYVIGGFVRDCHLNRKSKDIDIMVVGSGIKMAQQVAKVLGPKTNVSVFESFGTAMVHSGSFEIEFVGARKESYRRGSRKPIVENGTLEDDQIRRDFTINAMAFSLNKEDYGQLIDPFNGLKDIEDRIIRTPTDPQITFSDDPLRMIRAIRFASQLDFDIHPDTFATIKPNKNRLSILSKERVTDELNKILLSSKPSKGMMLLDQSGLLSLILPELNALKGVEKRNKHQHKDNFNHSLEVLDNVAKQSDDLWLRWAALLHDIAKPIVKKYVPETGWTFHGHEFVGSKMIPGIFKNLRLPLHQQMKYVQKIVALHLRPIVLSQEEITDSAIRRLLFDAGEEIEDLMLLCEADITSKNETLKSKYLANLQLVRLKLKEIEEKDAIRNFQPPITGEDIMKIFNLTPCKAIGDLKLAIKDAILDGKIANSYEEAYRYMLQKAGEMGINPNI